MDDFLLKAIFAGIAIAVVAGILGCFVVWKKMAYFGDSLAHSSLLGVVLGMFFGFGANLGILIVSVIFIVVLLFLQHRQLLATDTLLGILAHGGLSCALIGVSLMPDTDIDLHDLLFGDIANIAINDVFIIYTASLIVVFTLVYKWDEFVLIALHRNLAQAEGVNVFLFHVIFMILMTLSVAISIRIVGVLLIASMLIIPAASARFLSKSPESMAIYSVIIGVIGVVIGIIASNFYGTPSGPSIVMAVVCIFILSLLINSSSYFSRGFKK